jgi:hypothetical protein
MNVFAIQPGNASTKGINFHRQDGTLCVLRPGEKREYHIEMIFGMELETQ